MIALANGGWCQWDNQLGSFNGQATSGAALVNGGALWPSAWARAAGVTLTAEQEAELCAERDSDTNPNHPCQFASKAAFLTEALNTAERRRILAAAKASVEVEDLLFVLSNTSTPDRRHPAMQQGLADLEAAGLLDPGGANRILGK